MSYRKLHFTYCHVEFTFRVSQALPLVALHQGARLFVPPEAPTLTPQPATPMKPAHAPGLILWRAGILVAGGGPSGRRGARRGRCGEPALQHVPGNVSRMQVYSGAISVSMSRPLTARIPSAKGKVWSPT